MAKKKREEEEIDTGGWINTFADLMNLLLCFFVLLFSMSTVDAEKYEQLVASFSSNFSVLDGGAQAIGEGKLVSSGASQLNELDEYINDVGKAADETEEAKDPTAEYEEDKSSKVTLEEYEKAKAEKQKKETEELYSEVVKATEKKQIEDEVNVSMDPNHQYVMLSLSGGILFDSGSADIRKDAKTLISRVGDILKIYDARTIKILGHTDNVPIHNSEYDSNVWLSTARATKVFEYLVTKKKMDPNTLESAGRGEYDPIAKNTTAKGRAKNRRVEIRIYTNED